MTYRAFLSAGALLLASCGGGSTVEVDRVTEDFDRTMRLIPPYYSGTAQEFTSRNGVIDVEVRLSSPASITYLVTLLYVGGDVPHNEGPGGVSAQGPGPILSARWDVGFSGRFLVRISPLSETPLPVPPEGVSVPVTFRITHP